MLPVQQTAKMVGYSYNKYECWSRASVSDMHACMHIFTEVCLTMRALSGARCTDARPYTLQIKIGTANAHIVDLASDMNVG